MKTWTWKYIWFSWYCVALGFHDTTNMCYLVFGCPLGWKPQVGIVVLQMLRGWFWHLEAMTNLEKWWLVFWLVGWLVLWSPGAAGAFLWRPPGCPYSGRQAEALGRAGGFGRGEGPRGWIIEKSGRICSPTPFRLNCNPVWCTWFLGPDISVPRVLLATWWTNDHKWWRGEWRIGATHSRILLVFEHQTKTPLWGG